MNEYRCTPIKFEFHIIFKLPNLINFFQPLKIFKPFLAGGVIQKQTLGRLWLLGHSLPTFVLYGSKLCSLFIVQITLQMLPSCQYQLCCLLFIKFSSSYIQIFTIFYTAVQPWCPAQCHTNKRLNILSLLLIKIILMLVTSH